MCLIFLRQHYLVQVYGYILSIRFFSFPAVAPLS